MAAPKPKPLSLAIQAEHLRQIMPESRYLIEASELRWWGSLLPSPLSQSYRVKLTYRLTDKPKVHILSPQLIIPPGRKLPHIWSEDNLCLYFPDHKEWHLGKTLAHTVLPWASEWLFFYEIWLATGEWVGGGTTH